MESVSSLDLKEIFQRASDETVKNEIDKTLLDPFKYLQDDSRNESWKEFILAMNCWLKVSPKKLEAILKIMQTIHWMDLLTNDINSNCTDEHNQDSFILPSMINTTFYITQLLWQRLDTLEHPEAFQITVDTNCLRLDGEAREIYWRDLFKWPTERDYKNISVKKTTGNLIYFVRLMQLFSKNNDDFSQLIYLLGLFLDIQKDYKELLKVEEIEENDDSKSRKTEITIFQRFLFPIVHAIERENGTYGQVCRIFKTRSNDVNVQKYFVKLLGNSGSLEYTERVLDELFNEIHKEITVLGHNPLMNGLLLNQFNRNDRFKSQSD